MSKGRDILKINKFLVPAFAVIYSAMGINILYANENIEAACQEKSYKADIVPKKMTVQEKKLRFRCLIQPAVEDVFSELMEQYNDVLKAINAGSDSEKIRQLKVKYKVESNKDLLKAIKPHPKSIAVAQAAMESAWGTSRFFKEANNIFGVWSFNKNEPRIAAGKKRGNKTIWVKKYPSIKASIADYYFVLARGRAFSEFRSLKMTTADPYLLVEKLNHYSERKAAYGKELASMIRYNKFYKLD
ncbi:MAG: glucosaminidase domain-containing protein [Mariprofundaceae bacterium]|nr:glucosaminidase domain-containing protein [Mariprofundaceae bacterium]